jgi:hypothetical protein
VLFLLGWRTYPESWRSGFGQALPDLPAGRQAAGGHPKGLGLEGIHGASYAFDVPAKQKWVRNPSGTRNKLQVKVFPDDSFHGFGNLTVQSSLKPRYCKAVRYEYLC